MGGVWPEGTSSDIPTLLRVGDIIRVWRDHDPDLCLITGERESDGGPWPATIFPVGLADAEDPADAAAFDHRVPADFAERAAHEGRIYAARDQWSTWTEESM